MGTDLTATITKGVARYGGDFNPPQGPYSAYEALGVTRPSRPAVIGVAMPAVSYEAEYTVFGDGNGSGICGSTRGWENDDMLAQRYEVPADGLLVSVAAWVHSQTGDRRMAVYADDAGEPGDLLGEAAGKSVTGTGHFEEFELLEPVAVSELDLVWICVLASPEIYSCDAGAPVESLARRILARTYENGFPDPFGSASSYSANRSMRGKIWTNPP